MKRSMKILLAVIVIVLVAITAGVAFNTGDAPVLVEKHQYSEKQASDRLETLKAAQSEHKVEVIPMRFFLEELRPDDGTFALTAITTMREEDIAAVSFRATNSTLPELEKWYDATREGSGRYHLTGSAVDLGLRSGTYTIEAYITPAGGGETDAGKIEFDMELDSYFYSEALGDGKQSLVLVDPRAEGEFDGVRFKVWSVEDDQDDIKVYDAVEDPEGVWNAEIDVHDFADKGEFIANAYVVYGSTDKTDQKDETDKTEEADKKEETAQKEESGQKEETEQKEESGQKEEAEQKEESGQKEETEQKEESAPKEEAEQKEESGQKEETEQKEESAQKEETEKKEEPEKKEEEEQKKEDQKEQGEQEEREVGIASEQFELLPEPLQIPEGAGEVVKEGKRVYVKVPEILQTPELPTGCESVALTIDLVSMGYELEKTDIMKNYLEIGTDMATSYVGDPYSQKGAGCFPPAITAAANKFLEEKQSERKAYNITGTPIDELCQYIDNGSPVILWSSMYMANPTKTGNVYTYQGQTYTWYRSEHCVVLYGYDEAKDVYLVSDPLNGLVERDAAAFQKIYDDIGRYAVVIY